ncbi:Lysylphosphatidylglycerol synthetase family protein [Rhodovastum atsumiense]|uniref:Lysylphosphatidylglycerol synthetase family protein n=1 Tax=Rhodovastum atsumiense TaxID=504468 RepID=A0A5M6ITI9_9PROT|nr:lysylphosphatidylglycerol synthase domain-containing protein [Rhodovastum atsumiense]KAA5610765.1 lysylphosphatidylglycerol synthetase family protein [Rhodovastum atsumiense]CAH2604429.1 Lysylphosphatidylglycerol synthetase family protein [Rhodovastum atsumiense]
MLKRWLRHLPAILGVVLLIGAIYVVQKEFRSLKIEDIARALEGIPREALAISFGWTLLSYGILTFYDRLGTYYAGRPVSYGKVAFASFCAYSLAHNLGFAAVSGAAVRYRLYAHWGLTPLQIAKVVAFCSLTFGLGGMVLGGIVLFVEPEAVPFFGQHLPTWVMYAIGLLLWAIVAAYITLSRMTPHLRLFGHEIELPGWRMAIVQVMLATVDVAVTAAIVHALLPEAQGMNYIRFLGVYVASYTAGLAANIPGGIGVFDTAMLLGLSPYMDPPQIVGAIVVFRLYYYIIPLFLAGGLFAGNEILLRGRSLLKAPPGRRGVAVARWSEPDFVVAAVTGAVGICGALLLGLGVLQHRPDFSWIDPDFGEVASQAGEFAPSLIGAALMVCAIALSQRVTLAWGLTIGLLLLAAAFTVVQGQPVWIPGLLVLAALLIAPFRSAFYRHARLLTGKLDASVVVPLLTLIGCVLALVANEKHVRWLADNSWWEVVLSPELSNSLRATVALAVLLALLALWRLLRPGRVGYLRWGAEARLRYASLGTDPPARADGIIWGEAERAGIPFRRVGRVMLGLGDPAGADSDRVSAIWRLRDLARQEGLTPAIWRAERGLLKVYADLGLAALPLGPDGMPLGDAEDEEGPHATHYLVCRAERDLSTLLPLLPQLDHPEQAAAE